MTREEALEYAVLQLRRDARNMERMETRPPAGASDVDVDRFGHLIDNAIQHRNAADALEEIMKDTK